MSRRDADDQCSERRQNLLATLRRPTSETVARRQPFCKHDIGYDRR